MLLLVSRGLHLLRCTYWSLEATTRDILGFHLFILTKVDHHDLSYGTMQS